MNLSRLLSVLKTLVLRGLGSGVSVLFTILVSRHLAISESSSFFILFNASVIAAVCFRWGMDEVVIRRVAAADVQKRGALGTALVIQTHRRVFMWMAATLLLGLVFMTPWAKRQVHGLEYVDFGLMVAAAALIACAAAGARVLQGEGRTDIAAFYLNIWVPSFALVSFVLLILLKGAVTARELFCCYLFAALMMYTAVVPSRYGRRLVYGLLPGKDRSSVESPDVAAANRLGTVVMAQQVLGWSAVAIIPLFYGEAAYSGFVVAQKLATVISLLTLAINFTFSSRFAVLFSKRNFCELRSIIRTSIVAILLVSAVVLVVGWLSMAPVLEYARVSHEMKFVVIIMMFSQVAFSIAALLALILSMCHMDRYLLRAHMAIAVLSILAFVTAGKFASIAWAAMVFVISYSALAVALYVKMREVLKGRESGA